MAEKKNHSEFKSFRDLAQFAASAPADPSPTFKVQSTSKETRNAPCNQPQKSASQNPKQSSNLARRMPASEEPARPTISSISPVVERKLREKDELIESLQLQLADALREKKEWEERWGYEKDINIDISTRCEAFQDEARELSLQIDALLNSTSPLHAYPVINWLSFPTNDSLFQRPEVVCIEGFGPITDVSWNNYLHRQGIRMANQAAVIIVGKQGWCPTRLESLIDTDDFESVQVYSQELFLAAMFTGKNPFSASRDVLEEFAKDHSALQYLLKIGFEWPIGYDHETLDESLHISKRPELVEQSPLHVMGYRVGATGLSPFSRRRILESAYRGNLPSVADAAYMQEWGFRRTRRRLWRMAYHIAMLIRKNKNQTKLQTAVDEWSEDLDWMRTTFYKNSMHFDWPFNANR